jgi:hypothetical protein
MSLHAQKKGKRGEVEFCAWLNENFGIKTERNYNQADGTSSDVIIADFIFEVKRRESLSLSSWWHQVVVAAKNHKDKNLIPVVAFRQNRQPWEFLLPAYLLQRCELGYIRVNERVFIQFARNLIL